MLLVSYYKNPSSFLIGIIVKLSFLFPDRLYLKLLYRLKMGKKLDLKNPVSYTEKLQWLKLYDHNPCYSMMVDKVIVKDYVAKIIGKKYIIPTLKVWNNTEEIDISQLPEQYVLKCNHMGGGNVFICKNNIVFDLNYAKQELSKQLRTNPFEKTREWPYKNVNRKILCEKYMEDDNGELRDYKFYCFNGEIKVILVASNRFTTHNFDYFDTSFHPLPIISAAGPNSNEIIQKPEAFEEMKMIASKLSQGIPHVRVDLYYCNNQVYFGELTFYDSSGYDDLSSEYWNNKFGNWIILPPKRK